MHKQVNTNDTGLLNCYDLGTDKGRSLSGSIFDNLPDLLRPKVAAKLLGLSVKTIYDWKYRGQMRSIPTDLFIKINRSLYVNTRVLRRWILNNN